MSFFKITYDEALYLEVQDKNKIKTDKEFYYIAGIEKVQCTNLRDFFLEERMEEKISLEEKFNKKDLILSLIISKKELSYDCYLDGKSEYDSTDITSYPEIYEEYMDSPDELSDLDEDDLLTELEKDPDFVRFFVDEMRDLNQSKINIKKTSKKWEG